jgi:hypothetical protein
MRLHCFHGGTTARSEPAYRDAPLEPELAAPDGGTPGRAQAYVASPLPPPAAAVAPPEEAVLGPLAAGGCAGGTVRRGKGVECGRGEHGNGGHATRVSADPDPVAPDPVADPALAPVWGRMLEQIGTHDVAGAGGVAGLAGIAGITADWRPR